MKELKECPICGGVINHESDARASEMFDGYDEGDDALVSFYRCTQCGREIEITDPSESERETDYKDYWQ